MATKPDSVFRSLDRKAAAIVEFTLRQYRTRTSTWVVLGVGFTALALIFMIYIDVMGSEFESVDNDGDSFDEDGDGYPTGQERRLGTDPFSDESHPGMFDPPIEPEPASNYINEDGFDWDVTGSSGSDSTGYDNDGDCLNSNKTASQKDTNENGIPCDIIVQITTSPSGEIITKVIADAGVDEDPDEDAYSREATHLAFVLSIGKLGFVLLLGIFLPLFLATGLIRDEMTSGTMHFMLAKPVARSEIFLYRVLGYLGIVWPYIIALGILGALVSGFVGSGDDFFRFADLGVWLAIIFATMMATLVYGMLFNALGVLWKYGIILAIPFAAWELGMALLSMGAPDSTILRFSVIGWALMIVDSAAMMVWPNLDVFILMGEWGGGGQGSDIFGSSSLRGTVPLYFFSSKPGLGLSGFASSIVATLVLLVQAVVFWFIGGALFKGKEIQ
ncbi:ABC transporter permease [Candidatus Poseidoniaceae archaeon]|nr:ABC transporter permease subunit [Candidatus Poseidoniaceae archaeon]MDA9828209.1 ABC transporter permease [Candidatus Poseidoniaceae archaeon]